MSDLTTISTVPLLRVMVYPGESAYVAQIVELDIAAQAKSIRGLREALRRQIQDVCELAERKGVGPEWWKDFPPGPEFAAYAFESPHAAAPIPNEWVLPNAALTVRIGYHPSHHDDIKAEDERRES